MKGTTSRRVTAPLLLATKTAHRVQSNNNIVTRSNFISPVALETAPNPKRSYGNSQVRKGGWPPLQRSVMNISSSQAYIRWSLHTTAGFLRRVTRRYAGAGASHPSEPANWQG